MVQMAPIPARFNFEENFRMIVRNSVYTGKTGINKTPGKHRETLSQKFQAPVRARTHDLLSYRQTHYQLGHAGQNIDILNGVIKWRFDRIWEKRYPDDDFHPPTRLFPEQF